MAVLVWVKTGWINASVTSGATVKVPSLIKRVVLSPAMLALDSNEKLPEG